LNNNCKRIAHIGGNINCPLIKQIATGYKTAIKKGGVVFNSNFEIFSDQLNNDVMKAAELIYSQKERPDAILVDDVQAAQKLITFLQTRKIKIPDDVSVIAIGDEQDYSFYSPSITTVQFRYSAVGKRAARMLLQQIQNTNLHTDDEIIIEPFDLKIRNSTLKY